MNKPAKSVRQKSNGQPLPEDSEAPATEVEGAQGAQLAHPGAVVMRIPTDTPGEENIQIFPVNGLDPLSIPTLLRKAAALHEKILGI